MIETVKFPLQFLSYFINLKTFIMRNLKILIVITSLVVLSIPNYGTSLGDSQTMKISGYNLSELNIDSRNRTIGYTENLTVIVATAGTGTILRKIEKY